MAAKLAFLKSKPIVSGGEVQSYAQPKATQTNDPAPQPKPKSGISFLKKGKDAHTALEKEKLRSDERKAEFDKLFRFFVQRGESANVTFLNGKINDLGMIDCLMCNEHLVTVGGNKERYVCTLDTEGWCPLCDRADTSPYLIGLFTIINHTPYTVRKGTNAGKEYRDRRQLFTATQSTLGTLTKLAIENDGSIELANFDIGRSTKDNAPAVGDSFTLLSKYPSKEAFLSKYDLEVDAAEEAIYDDELTYRSADTLVKMGLGKALRGPGTNRQSSASIDKTALKNEL